MSSSTMPLRFVVAPPSSKPEPPFRRMLGKEPCCPHEPFAHRLSLRPPLRVVECLRGHRRILTEIFHHDTSRACASYASALPWRHELQRRPCDVGGSIESDALSLVNPGNSMSIASDTDALSARDIQLSRW
jgi:hypothetical protein